MEAKTSPAPSKAEQKSKFDFEVEWAKQLKLGLPQSVAGTRMLCQIFWNLGYAGGVQYAVDSLRRDRLGTPERIYHASTCQCDKCKPVSSPAGEPSPVLSKEAS